MGVLVAAMFSVRHRIIIICNSLISAFINNKRWCEKMTIVANRTERARRGQTGGPVCGSGQDVFPEIHVGYIGNFNKGIFGSNGRDGAGEVRTGSREPSLGFNQFTKSVC